ncbi:hypothetical protein CGLO_18292 [Colletotrichum gloeosporioides Cg-14]|uniref:Uncharacterized protein n=1 Tax=Colletotrichum gloeosporioides (strain Cg-14) TaxID=1237896 RepID=T0KUZ5_COLGC|nr:hypothetical protein CGLO_18292 [Colletotrichum gloeosporioides Cg-14]
MHIKYNFAY